MGWQPDVAPYDTIQSLWGNTIRDRSVIPFATRAERNAQAVPKSGMVCWCEDVQTLYVRIGAAWVPLVMPWRTFTPKAWFVDVNNAAVRTPMSVSGIQHALWRQCLGVMQTTAEYAATLPSGTGTPSFYIAVLMGPANPLNSGTAGSVRVGVSSTNTGNGGQTEWLGNDAGGGGMYLVSNVGDQARPRTVVVQTTGPGGNGLYISQQGQYACDPTYDP